MTQESLNTLITMVILPVLIVLSGYVSAWLKKKIDVLGANAKTELQYRYTTLAGDVVSAVVQELMQTVVNKLKAEGTWNKEVAESTYNEALVRIKAILGEKGLEILSTVYTDLDGWLRAQIETSVSYKRMSSYRVESCSPVEVEADA